MLFSLKKSPLPKGFLCQPNRVCMKAGRTLAFDWDKGVWVEVGSSAVPTWAGATPVQGTESVPITSVLWDISPCVAVNLALRTGWPCPTRPQEGGTRFCHVCLSTTSPVLGQLLRALTACLDGKQGRDVPGGAAVPHCTQRGCIPPCRPAMFPIWLV